METETISSMWGDAKVKFKELTGKSLDQGRMQSFEDVEKEIESRQKPVYPQDNAPTDGWHRAKIAGLKVLRGLKLLVGFATQVSSLAVPGPSQPAANFCCNAISMLLDIPKQIKDFDDAINDVFTRVSVVLYKVRIYERLDEVDNLLALLIHKLMVSFVIICAKAIKYQQGTKWERFQQRAKKSIFDDDSGLKAEMENFERLVKEHHHAEGTVTLEEVLKQKKTLNRLLDDATERKSDDERIKKLKHIIETFGIDQNVRLDTVTTQTCTELFKRCLPGTGDWVWNHQAYETWTSKDRTNASPLLLLVGGPKSGKTSAVATIIKKLEKLEFERTTRTCVAHYFFPTIVGKTDEDKYPIQAALKYMAFQLAREDNTVATTLDKLCTEYDGVKLRSFTLEELWDKLKLGDPGLGATYYLVFDGLEGLHDKDSESLNAFLSIIFGLQHQSSSDSVGPRVRVLASGTEAVFQQHLSDRNKRAVMKIKDHSVEDMKLYIDNELKNRGLLQNVQPGSKQERARQIIHEFLPKNVDGSYSLLQSGIGNIARQLNSRADLTELEKSLSESGNGHQAMVQNLQKSLEPEEIEELNELLKWVIFGEEPFDVNQLQAAMVLHSGNDPLLTLEYMIEQKYSSILKYEDYVSILDGVDEVVQNERSTTRNTIAAGGPKISATITITDVDQEVCQHFLWDLAHKGIREKFKFDFDAPSSLQRRKKAEISVNEFDAHLSIVLQTFKFIEAEPNERTKAIGRYILQYLPSHLKHLSDMQGINTLLDSDKRDIGHFLFDLFESDRTFVNHKDIFECFTWDVQDVDVFRKWFDDPVATKSIYKKWLREARTRESPQPGFLRELMNVVVKHWLRDRSWNAGNAYDWVASFYSMDCPDHEADNKTVGSSGNDIDFNYDKAGIWCQKLLNLRDDQLDSLWFERLGEAALTGDDYTAAIDNYTKASGLPDPNWQCYKGLGLANSKIDNLEQAILNMEKALDIVKNSPTSDSSEIGDLHLLLGNCYSSSNKKENAVEHFRMSLCNPKNIEEATFALLKVELLSESEDRPREILRQMHNDSQELLVSCLRRITSEEDSTQLFSKIFQVSSSDNALITDIVDDMREASDIGNNKRDRDYQKLQYRGVLLFHRGVASYLYKLPQGCKFPDDALKLWEECFDVLECLGGDIAYITRRAAISAISLHYFHTMMDDRKSQYHIEDLVKLASVASEAQIDLPKGYLGSLYAERGEPKNSMKLFQDDMKVALQILCDEFDWNDKIGYFLLANILLRHKDIPNAMTALSFLAQADLVTEKLTFDEEPEKRLGRELTLAVCEQIPDSSCQLERIEAARERVNKALECDHPGNGDEGNRVKKAYENIKSTLDGLYSELSSLPFGQFDLDGLSSTCDNDCGRKWDYRNDLYFCLFCHNTSFCSTCLQKICDNRRDNYFGVFKCNYKHKWLQMPRWGAEVYEKPRRGIVEVGGKVCNEHGNEVGSSDQILKVDRIDSKTMSVQAWKEKLSAEWGFSLEDIAKETLIEEL